MASITPTLNFSKHPTLTAIINRNYNVQAKRQGDTSLNMKLSKTSSF